MVADSGTILLIGRSARCQVVTIPVVNFCFRKFQIVVLAILDAYVRTLIDFSAVS